MRIKNRYLIMQIFEDFQLKFTTIRAGKNQSCWQSGRDSGYVVYSVMLYGSGSHSRFHIFWVQVHIFALVKFVPRLSLSRLSQTDYRTKTWMMSAVGGYYYWLNSTFIRINHFLLHLLYLCCYAVIIKNVLFRAFYCKYELLNSKFIDFLIR